MFQQLPSCVLVHIWAPYKRWHHTYIGLFSSSCRWPMRSLALNHLAISTLESAARAEPHGRQCGGHHRPGATLVCQQASSQRGWTMRWAAQGGCGAAASEAGAAVSPTPRLRRVDGWERARCELW